MHRVVRGTIVPLGLIAASALAGACGKKSGATADSAGSASSGGTGAAGASTGASTTTGSTTAAVAGSSGTAPADPSQFSDANILAKEIAGDSAEVVLAGVARDMATDPKVKAYAAQLVKDHSKGMREASALAKKLSITPETPAGDTTAAETSHMQDKLKGLAKGPAFDTVFVNHEVEDHQADIKDAKAMSGAAKNAQVKALVNKALPELQKHLDEAQKLVKSGK